MPGRLVWPQRRDPSTRGKAPPPAAPRRPARLPSGAVRPAGVIAAGLALAFCAAQAAPLRAPQRVGEPACELPAGASAVLGHALIQYRVTAEGDVDRARAVYSVMRPESLRAEAVEALERCVLGWRYRPARSGGQPVAEWLLAAFHLFEPVPDGAPMVAIPGNRTMPLAHLETLRREKQALAMFLLSGPDFRQVQGPGYELRTDVPGGGVETLLAGLEHARRAFQAAFPGAHPPDGARLNLHVFARQEEFNQVVAFDELALTHVPLTGQYAPDGQTVFLSAGEKPLRMTGRVVAHEVTHHLVHQGYFRGDASPPFWVSEGIAAFIENMPAQEDTPPVRHTPSAQDLPQATAPAAAPDFAALERGLRTEQGYTWMADADRYLRRLRDSVREHGAMPVADLLEGRGVDGHDRTLPYGLSWLLVHFLMNSDGGAHRDAFRAWLAGPAAAADTRALLESLSMTTAELSGRLEAWRRELQRGSGDSESPRRSVR